ncbi:substrate-binding domain-containing protein [Arthrobacter sp. 24S4-2]|uniref:substrate-binding domain-containing protein n=1 Tax=Arthrobacter sp. 24S4-2 TaxID=2575374 RepID=UPI001586B8E1|nr:substrate-binding domain-containing protein [Arthrobacter sp. 24S4-2]
MGGVVELLGQRLHELDAPPTAVFAGNDLQAMGLMSAASLRSIRVPDQPSVVGFDDIGQAAMARRKALRPWSSPRNSSCGARRWRPRGPARHNRPPGPEGLSGRQGWNRGLKVR